jgi:hypothetical protein
MRLQQWRSVRWWRFVTSVVHWRKGMQSGISIRVEAYDFNHEDPKLQAQPLLPLVRVPMILIAGRGVAFLGYLSVQQVNPGFGFDKAFA